MSVLKKIKVVMLPTNEEAQITLGVSNVLHKGHSHPDNNQYRNQHLYFLSDNEEIKKGDWYYDTELENVSQCSYMPPFLIKRSRKIIASTDILFTVTKDMINPYIPKPSQSFIEKYIEKYNAGNPITEVMVEYNSECGYQYCGGECIGL